LGGPFLEDFRLIHARLGINEMVCIETDKLVHRRQEFNKPIESIVCLHRSLEDYLARTEFEAPVILWLDYTEPKHLKTQIETFAEQAYTMPVGSVIRLTLNANPASLCEVPKGEDSLKWRLAVFEDKVGEYCPAGLNPTDVSFQKYGASLLRTAQLAVERRMLDAKDRKICWALSTVYADGQPMATTTLVVLPLGDAMTPPLVKNWEFSSAPSEPLVLDMPALSTLERLTMEAYEDPKARMAFELPVSQMGQNPFETFKRFYRVFPHFSRVEL
jgi:hypothetical protein